MPLSLKGGYNSSYINNAGYTVLQGTLRIRRGTVIVNKVVVRP